LEAAHFTDYGRNVNNNPTNFPHNPQHKLAAAQVPVAAQVVAVVPAVGVRI